MHDKTLRAPRAPRRDDVRGWLLRPAVDGEALEDGTDDDVTEVECLHGHIGRLRRVTSFKTEARDVVNECYSRLFVLLQLVERSKNKDAPATKDDETSVSNCLSQLSKPWRLDTDVLQARKPVARGVRGSPFQHVLEKASGVVERQLFEYVSAELRKGDKVADCCFLVDGS